MKIVAIASHIPKEPYYMYEAFVASCNRFGHQPLILSEGYGGLATKPLMLRKAIEDGQIKDSLIIFCDAWDVVFQRDPCHFYEVPRWSSCNGNGVITWNAEKNCFPNPKLADKFPETKTQYRYLNSGFAVGATDAFLQAIKEINPAELRPDKKNLDGSYDNPNDQLVWQKQYLYGKTPMTLDSRCEICQTLAGVPYEELDFDEPLIKNKETGTTPIAFHLNGTKEQWKPIILNHLKL